MHTNGASDASVSVRLGRRGCSHSCVLCVCERTMYTLEYHHRCIHSVVVIVALSPPPSRCPRTNYAAVPRLSCWLVAHKTHSSKSTNGFRYEMHETDRQTYCAAFLPHRVRVPPPPSPSNPPLCATYIRSYIVTSWPFSCSLPHSLARYLCCPLWYAIWAAARNAVSINPRPPSPLYFYATADWGYLALLKLVLWKGYTQYPYATHQLRVSHPFILYADTRGMPRPLPPPFLPLSLAYQNAYCTLDKILVRHFSFNMQLGNSASKLKLDGGRMLAEGEDWRGTACSCHLAGCR